MRRGIRGDGTDANSSQTAQASRAHDLQRGNGQGLRTSEGGASNVRINARDNATQQSGSSSATSQTVAAPSDNFATTQASAWQQFMADMLGALDVALSAQDAAKDGKITSDEWSDIFGKATKDGQVSLLEISAMYAGLQDMHDKGALDDTEYKDGVASLERELSARYSGGNANANGLDNLARMYLQTLDTGGGLDDDTTAITASANRNVTQRRIDVNDDLSATLTDIGIRRHAADVNDPNRGTL